MLGGREGKHNSNNVSGGTIADVAESIRKHDENHFNKLKS